MIYRKRENGFGRIGATPEGRKELAGFRVGVRESAYSWRELLVDKKRRGIAVAPEIGVDGGAHGFWKALDEVLPGTPPTMLAAHEARVDVDVLPDFVEVSAVRQRIRCSACGARPMDVRPDWREARNHS